MSEWLTMAPAIVDTTHNKALTTTVAKTKTVGYILIPSFLFTGLTWTGCSRLLATFSYVLPHAFTLSKIPRCLNQSFIACIRWNVGRIVFRYMLWARDGLYAPIYNQHKLASNVKIEIWSTSVTTAELTSPIKLSTSSRYVQTADVLDSNNVLTNASLFTLNYGQQYPLSQPEGLTGSLSALRTTLGDSEGHILTDSLGHTIVLA